MSDFTDCYHLRASSKDDGVALLSRAKVEGYVFDPWNGWVNLVAAGSVFAPNQRLVSSNRGLLVHFIEAEDHGWGFEIYAGAQQLAHYECHWDPTFEVVGEVAIGEIRRALASCLDQGLNVGDVDHLLLPSTSDEVQGIDAPGTFAAWLGLENYDRLSFPRLEATYAECSTAWHRVTPVR